MAFTKVEFCVLYMQCKNNIHIKQTSEHYERELSCWGVRGLIEVNRVVTVFEYSQTEESRLETDNRSLEFKYWEKTYKSCGSNIGKTLSHFIDQSIGQSLIPHAF